MLEWERAGACFISCLFRFREKGRRARVGIDCPILKRGDKRMDNVVEIYVQI